MENQLLDSFNQQGIANKIIETEDEKQTMLKFSMLKPQLFKDDDHWCVLYGDNLQVGISGFGETPYKAILSWNQAWHTK